MKRPSTQTMVLGHPVATGIVILAASITGLAAWQAGDQYLVCGGSLFLIAAANTANEKAAAYKRWKAEWDSMGPGSPARRKVSFANFLQWAMAGLIALAVIAAVGGEPAYLDCLILLGLLLLAGMLIRKLARWAFGGRRSNSVRPVSIVAKPIMSAPSLAQAYARLPDHCQRILART